MDGAGAGAGVGAGAGAAAVGMAPVSSPVTSRLFRVRKTAASMLDKRGYSVLDADKDMKLAEFVERFGDPPVRARMQMMASHHLNEEDKIMVFFPEASVNVSAVQEFAKKMQGETVRRGIVIVEPGRITNQAKKALASFQSDMGLMMEHFKDEELLVDITQHELVPEHQLLSKEDKAKLLSKYKLQEQQLPRIHLHDPIARFFGLQRGDVVKIIRASETAGRYVTYRLAI